MESIVKILEPGALGQTGQIISPFIAIAAVLILLRVSAKNLLILVSHLDHPDIHKARRWIGRSAIQLFVGMMSQTVFPSALPPRSFPRAVHLLFGSVTIVMAIAFLLWSVTVLFALALKPELPLLNRVAGLGFILGFAYLARVMWVLGVTDIRVAKNILRQRR